MNGGKEKKGSSRENMREIAGGGEKLLQDVKKEKDGERGKVETIE